MNNIPTHLILELKKRIKHNPDNMNRWYIIFKFDVIPLLRKIDTKNSTPLLQELITVAQIKFTQRQSIHPIISINKDMLREIIKFDKTKLKPTGKINNGEQSWWNYFVSYVY
jgi:hypothetical protein